MENKENYVTKLEMERAHNLLTQNLEKKIVDVDDKVDSLRDIVLPMAESSKQTAENTKEIANTMKAFTEEQRQTNGKFYNRLHQHDLAFSGISGQFDAVGIQLAAKTEEKKNNTALWVAILTVIGGIVVGIFQAAPSFFN